MKLKQNDLLNPVFLFGFKSRCAFFFIIWKAQTLKKNKRHKAIQIRIVVSADQV